MSLLFSVVVPTYNRAGVLPRALDSVLRQEFSDFELIVVDDGSRDETRAIVESVDDPRMRYVFKQNGGLSAARNTGVAHSDGLYVTFLDDDDEALPGWLEGLAAKIRGAQPAIVSCGALVLDDEGREIEILLPRSLGGQYGYPGARALFRTGCYAARRDLVTAIGGYAVGARRNQNTELALRLVPLCASRRLPIEHIDVPMIRVHRHNPLPGHFQGKLIGANYILDHHRDKFANNRGHLCTYLSIAGVNAARSGAFDEARRFYVRAIVVRPLRIRNWLRLLTVLLPPLGRRVW